MSLNLEKFLFWAAVGVFFYFIQESRFLEVAGVVPNLVLILFFLACFKESGLRYGLAFFLGVFLASLIWTPFWIFDLLALAAVSILIYLLVSHSPADIFFNFVIALLLATVFYSALALPFVFGAGFHHVLILREIIYNLAIGALFWFLFRPKEDLGLREAG